MEKEDEEKAEDARDRRRRRGDEDAVEGGRALVDLARSLARDPPRP